MVSSFKMNLIMLQPLLSWCNIWIPRCILMKWWLVQTTFLYRYPPIVYVQKTNQTLNLKGLRKSTFSLKPHILSIIKYKTLTCSGNSLEVVFFRNPPQKEYTTEDSSDQRKEEQARWSTVQRWISKPVKNAQFCNQYPLLQLIKKGCVCVRGRERLTAIAEAARPDLSRGSLR